MDSFRRIRRQLSKSVSGPDIPPPSATRPCQSEEVELSTGLESFTELAHHLGKHPKFAILAEAPDDATRNLFRFFLSLVEWDRSSRSDAQFSRLNASKLLTMFVEPGSVHEVSGLTNGTRQRLIERQAMHSRTFFDEAKGEVARMVQERLRDLCPLSIMDGLDHLLL